MRWRTLSPINIGFIGHVARYASSSTYVSDVETIEMIRENPYIQYFCGLTEYAHIPIFDHSLFVTIRKRITIEEINKMTNALLKKEKETNQRGTTEIQ